MTNNTVGFWTPIEIRTPISPEDKVFNSVEGYFHISGRKAVVNSLCGNHLFKAELQQKKSSCLSTTFKIISYATIVFPLIMLAIKLVLRCTNPSILLKSDQSTKSEDSADPRTRKFVRNPNPSSSRKQNPRQMMKLPPQEGPTAAASSRLSAAQQALVNERKKEESINTLIQEGQLQEALNQIEDLPKETPHNKKTQLLHQVCEKGLEQEETYEVTKQAALSLQKLSTQGGAFRLNSLAEKQLEKGQPEEAFETLKLLQGPSGNLANTPYKTSLLTQIVNLHPDMAEDIAEHLRDALGENKYQTSFLTIPLARNYFRSGQLDKAFETLKDKLSCREIEEYNAINGLYLDIANHAIREEKFPLAHQAANEINTVSFLHDPQQEVPEFEAAKEHFATQKETLLNMLKEAQEKSLP